MKRIDILNDRIEACGCFTDSMTQLSHSDKVLEFLLEADPEKVAMGTMNIRGTLLHTPYSDELKADDPPNVITFVLNRVIVDGELVNAFVKIMMIAATTYKITYCETSKIQVTSDGKEYLV